MSTKDNSTQAETAPSLSSGAPLPAEAAPTSRQHEPEEQTPANADSAAPSNISIPPSLVPPISPEENAPVYRQYIIDRVKGNSYIPREYREGADKYGEKYLDEDGEDPTDCSNRPPHWLCYVPPCVGRYPGMLEQNKCCQRLGQIGIHSRFKGRHIARRRLFFLGFAFNLAALFLTTWASFAFSTNHGLLVRSSFARGEGKASTNSTSRTLLSLNVGFRAVAVDNVGDDLYNFTGLGSGDHVLLFDEFCDAGEGNFAQELQNGVCGSCRDSSQAFVVSVIFNVFIIIKNMFSDITRMYPRYDLNCPNLAGSLLATLSVFLGLWTISTYQSRCFNNIERSLDVEAVNNSTSQDEIVGEVTFDWWPGPGLTCLLVATFLRFVDAICNYIVPTPTITRSPQLRKEYEYEFGETKALREVKKGEAEESFHQPVLMAHASSRRAGDKTKTNDRGDEEMAEANANTARDEPLSSRQENGKADSTPDGRCSIM